MDRSETMTVQTAHGELRYFRNWDCDGSIHMENPQTIKRYQEIKDMHPDADACGVFFAFSPEQFQEGYKKLIELGHIKDGDKVISMGSGGYGTKQGLDKFISFYENNTKLIKDECDPQEVYFYEYNNHESMIAWDGDRDAIDIIIDIWGADVARTIKRHSWSISVDNIVREPIKVEGLYFNYQGERKTPSNLYFSNLLCYTMYSNVLYPVYASDGTLYTSEESLDGISAHYDGKIIDKFHTD